ncbi:MAG: serine protease [Acidobacteriaceae bacterium]|jgi:hypothetical protein
MRHRLQLQLGRWIIAATIGLTGCTYGLWQRASGQTKSADDQLSKYTFQELRQALDTRHNMALYPHSPVGIDKFTDRQIVDNIVGRQKAIYPHDRRRDYYQFKVHPDYERNSNSVAAIVVPPNFTWEHDIFRLLPLTLAEREHGLCKDQPFLEQEAVANCSAFVVGPDTIATAHHCIGNDYRSYKIVFGYRMDSPTQLHATQDVYTIKEVVKANDEANALDDFIVLRTDRIMQGHPPLPTRISGSIQEHDGVYMLGFPRGLPLKLADGASVLETKEGSHFFRADLDAFFGNSGSPVFNASTQIVEGILVRGEEDYGYLQDESCRVELVCPKLNGCAGEDVTAISVIADSVPPKVPPHPPIVEVGNQAKTVPPGQGQKSVHFEPDSPEAEEWCSHQPNGMTYTGSDGATHNCFDRSQKSAYFEPDSPEAKEWCSHQPYDMTYTGSDGATHNCLYPSQKSAYFEPNSPEAKEWCSHQPNGMTYTGSDGVTHDCAVHP